MKELKDKKCVSAKTQFEYAWCLVRSKYGADINNGVKIFEELCKDDPDNKRDYIYYLAIAYTRMKDFTTAQKYVQAFLEIEPNNMQVMLLNVSCTYVKEKCLTIKTYSRNLNFLLHQFQNFKKIIEILNF